MSEREHVKFSKVAEHRDKRKVERRGKRGRTRWTGLGEQWNPMKRGKKERKKKKKDQEESCKENTIRSTRRTYTIERNDEKFAATERASRDERRVE